MDLVTLLAVCTISVDTKLMHALVWRESGGEPWSVRVAAARRSRPYPTRKAALKAAATAEGRERPVRIGLTGLPSEREDTTLALSDLFDPCVNVALASRRLAALQAACPEPAGRKAAPVRCALGRWRGAERPDFAFADLVLEDARSGQLPNFDLASANEAKQVEKSEQSGSATAQSGEEPDQQQRISKPPNGSASGLFFMLHQK